jgi:hypothetical protein
LISRYSIAIDVSILYSIMSALSMINTKRRDDDSLHSSEDGARCDEKISTTDSIHSATNRDARDIACEEKEGIERLIQRENKEVKLWGGIVTLMLVLTASLVTYFAYNFLENEDIRDFNIGASTADTTQRYSCSLYSHALSKVQ